MGACYPKVTSSRPEAAELFPNGLRLSADRRDGAWGAFPSEDGELLAEG